MQFGVNFVEGKKTDSLNERTNRIIKLGVGIVLLVYALFSIAVFAASYYLSSSEKMVADQVAKTEKEVESFKKIETLEIALKQRIGDAGVIVNQREKDRKNNVTYSQLLQQLDNFVESGVTLKDVLIEKGYITFSGTAENYLLVGNLMDKIDNDGLWSYVHLDGLTRDSRGSYNFSLKVTP